MRNKNTILLLGFCFAVALLVFLKISLDRQDVSQAPAVAPTASDSSPIDEKQGSSDLSLVGEKMPDFTIKTSQGPLSLADLKNKSFVIEFIATTCPYCQASAPAFQSVFKDSKTTYIVLSALDEPIDLMKAWQRKYMSGTGGIVATNPDSLVQDLGLRGTPTTLFVDSQGKIKTLYPGEIGQEQIRAFLQEIE